MIQGHFTVLKVSLFTQLDTMVKSRMTELLFLLCFLVFYRAVLCIRGTSHGPMSVCPSVTSRSSIETAERIELFFGM